MMKDYFSWARLWAMILKEFVQVRRDRLTFAMMVGIPIIELALFGFAINADPKSLPMAVRSADESEFSRSFIQSLENTDYFVITAQPKTEAEANKLIRLGEVQFVLTIPADFSRKLERGERPQLLVEADATDPSATSNAIAALMQLSQQAFKYDLHGNLQFFKQTPAPFDINIHRSYNPEGITQYNIVPGLMAVILTMTMIMMTGLAIAREVEHGTMENLLATPMRPLEVMIGKIVPYIVIGYVQVGVIFLAAHFLFGVPMAGSVWLLLACVLVFIIANLTVGITFSSLARSQIQAMQMTFFFFLPSMLLSGFMFPFRGMPDWAQHIGSLLPMTHFLRIVRGIMLKGNTFAEVMPHVWPILLFTVVSLLVGWKKYRKTLD
jgi:ABC-2 type transport system permease protein